MRRPPPRFVSDRSDRMDSEFGSHGGLGTVPCNPANALYNPDGNVRSSEGCIGLVMTSDPTSCALQGSTSQRIQLEMKNFQVLPCLTIDVRRGVWALVASKLIISIRNLLQIPTFRKVTHFGLPGFDCCTDSHSTSAFRSTCPSMFCASTTFTGIRCSCKH
jgi:hypothetical protein